MKRIKITYKGETYFGDTPESIAARIARDNKTITEAEALEYVKSNFSNYSPSPGGYQETTHPKNLGLKDYISGATAVVNVSIGNNVDQTEINRRAVICSTCPKRTEIPGCMSCGFAGVLVKTTNNIKKLFGAGYTIPNGLEKNGCGVCSCALSVLIPSKTSAFKKTDDDKRPDICWIKKTSSNYIES